MALGGNVRESVFGYTQRDIYAHVHPLALLCLVLAQPLPRSHACTRTLGNAWPMLGNLRTNRQREREPIGFTMSAVAP